MDDAISKTNHSPTLAATESPDEVVKCCQGRERKPFEAIYLLAVAVFVVVAAQASVVCFDVVPVLDASFERGSSELNQEVLDFLTSALVATSLIS